MDVLVSGANGRLGSVLCGLLREGWGGHRLVGSGLQYSDITPPHVAIDFSHPGRVYDLCTFCRRHGLPLVLATTGHTPAQQAAVRQAARHIPVFWAANLSLGIALLQQLALSAADFMPGADIAITEQHRRGKLDAPSGTALQLAAALGHTHPDKSIQVHALRLGSLTGKHSILFATQDEVITLTHETHTPQIYAKGALRAAEFVVTQPPGLYGMSDLISHIQKEQL